MLIFIILWQFIYVSTHFQINIDCTLTGINASSQYAHMGHCSCIKSFLHCKIGNNILFRGSDLRQYSYLIFFYHLNLQLLLLETISYIHCKINQIKSF